MQAALRAPSGLRALAGLWRALAARRERRGASRRGPRPRPLVGARGLALPRGAPSVLTVHGTDAALLRRSRIARTLARPVFRRATVVTAVSRELAGWVQSAPAGSWTPSHVQPMPVDSRDRPWTAAVAAPSSSPGSPPRSGSPWRSRPWRSSPPAATRCRSPSSATAPSARRSSAWWTSSASPPWCASPGPSPRLKSRLPWPGRPHDLSRPGRRFRSGGRGGADGRRAGGGLLGRRRRPRRGASHGAGRLTLPSPEAMGDAILGLLLEPDHRAWLAWWASPGARGSRRTTWPRSARGGIARPWVADRRIRAVQWVLGIGHRRPRGPIAGAELGSSSGRSRWIGASSRAG